ncbi:MAG TPA: hypothetical protein VIQ11_05810, partial [Mycobacterium sp.]
MNPEELPNPIHGLPTLGGLKNDGVGLGRSEDRVPDSAGIIERQFHDVRVDVRFGIRVGGRDP